MNKTIGTAFNFSKRVREDGKATRDKRNEVMLKIPELTSMDVAMGNIKHMPKFTSLPDEFRKYNSNPYCNAVSSWFFGGGTGNGKAFATNDGDKFKPKDGVNGHQALMAIRAVLGSFEPKHEHKIAACGYMLSEWFDAEFKKG